MKITVPFSEFIIWTIAWIIIGFCSNSILRYTITGAF